MWVTNVLKFGSHRPICSWYINSNIHLESTSSSWWGRMLPSVSCTIKFIRWYRWHVVCIIIIYLELSHRYGIHLLMLTQVAKFMGLTWDPPGSCRPQMGPILVPWTLLSGKLTQHVSPWSYMLGRCQWQDRNYCTLTARFMGPTRGPPGAYRTQVGPMLAPWTLLSGYVQILWYVSLSVSWYSRPAISPYSIYSNLTDSVVLYPVIWDAFRASLSPFHVFISFQHLSDSSVDRYDVGHRWCTIWAFFPTNCG